MEKEKNIEKCCNNCRYFKYGLCLNWRGFICRNKEMKYFIPFDGVNKRGICVKGEKENTKNMANLIGLAYVSKQINDIKAESVKSQKKEKLQDGVNALINDFRSLTDHCIEQSEISSRLTPEDLIWVSFALNYYLFAIAKKENSPVPIVLNDVVYSRIESLLKKVIRMMEEQ